MANAKKVAPKKTTVKKVAPKKPEVKEANENDKPTPLSAKEIKAQEKMEKEDKAKKKEPKKVISPRPNGLLKPVKVKKLDSAIDRVGYTIFFVSPSDEVTLNELRNTGRVIGEINYDSGLAGEQGNEIAVAVKE